MALGGAVNSRHVVRRRSCLLPHSVHAADVEELTLKTGNSKKFAVFVKMLAVALSPTPSDTVFIDLLTHTDLEVRQLALRDFIPRAGDEGAQAWARCCSIVCCERFDCFWSSWTEEK